MKIPKMILFNYGQTLVAEQKMDPIKGTEAVLRYATKQDRSGAVKGGYVVNFRLIDLDGASKKGEDVV